jgi:CRP-like cAMP-binding protein
VEIQDVLKKTYLFYTLDDDELKQLSQRARLQSFGKGEEIFAEGSAGGSLYIIKDGKVNVEKTLSDGVDAVLVELGQYFFFGEISLFDGGKRSATVTAVEPTECVIIDKPDFWEAMMANPVSAHKVYRAILSFHSNSIRRANERFRSFLGQALDNI